MTPFSIGVIVRPNTSRKIRSMGVSIKGLRRAMESYTTSGEGGKGGVCKFLHETAIAWSQTLALLPARCFLLCGGDRLGERMRRHRPHAHSGLWFLTPIGVESPLLLSAEFIFRISLYLKVLRG